MNTQSLIIFIQGILVGFSAIMPGISGGTLCVAFSMYYPIMSILSDLNNIKIYGIKVGIFVLGGLTGFLGLSSLASYLLETNMVIMSSLFVGFIIGTLNDLWHESGVQGRTKLSYIVLIIGFIGMYFILNILSKTSGFALQPNFLGYFISGVLWGLSFIIPGLSSSSLLLFFNIYTPMLKGISSFDFSVLIPLAIGMIVCVLLLSKIINSLFMNYYNIISHTILGIVVSTIVMIIPSDFYSLNQFIYSIIMMLLGMIISYCLSKWCSRFK